MLPPDSIAVTIGPSSVGAVFLAATHTRTALIATSAVLEIYSAIRFILKDVSTLRQFIVGRVAEFVEHYDLDWFEPTGVNGFPTILDGFQNGKEFCRSLFEAESVVLAPGDVFGYPDRFRIGFGLHTEELVEGLERVGHHIANYS